jgi:hypothetical protein
VCDRSLWRRFEVSEGQFTLGHFADIHKRRDTKCWR